MGLVACVEEVAPLATLDAWAEVTYSDGIHGIAGLAVQSYDLLFRYADGTEVRRSFRGPQGTALVTVPSGFIHLREVDTNSAGPATECRLDELLTSYLCDGAGSLDLEQITAVTVSITYEFNGTTYTTQARRTLESGLVTDGHKPVWMQDNVFVTPLKWVEGS
jgi:hypothetical protein